MLTKLYSISALLKTSENTFSPFKKAWKMSLTLFVDGMLLRSYNLTEMKFNN